MNNKAIDFIPIMRFRHYPLLIVMVLLIIWKGFLGYLLPQAELDPIWYLSPTFSILRGELSTSTFGHFPVVPYSLPYLYSVIAAPFFVAFPFREYSIFVWNILLVILIIILIFRLFDIYEQRLTLLAAIVPLSFLVSPYMYGPRPEVLNIVLLLLILTILSKSSLNSQIFGVVFAGLLTAFAGLSQPVGGIFSLLMILIYAIEMQFTRKLILTYFVSTALTILVLYGPIVMIDFDSWRYNFFERFSTAHGINIVLFLKYTIYTPFILFPYVVAIISLRDFRKTMIEFGLFAFMLIVLLPFNHSYYYSYLLVFVFWRIIKMGLPIPGQLLSLVSLVILLISPFFSHYWPTLQQIENPDYAQSFKRTYDAVLSYRDQSPDNQIFVPPSVGFAVIDLKNSRLIIEDYARLYEENAQLTPNDIILITSYSQLQHVINLQDGLDESQLEIREIIPESRGLITLDVPPSRSEGVGLWEIRLCCAAPASYYNER